MNVRFALVKRWGGSSPAGRPPRGRPAARPRRPPRSAARVARPPDAAVTIVGSQNTNPYTPILA